MAQSYFPTRLASPVNDSLQHSAFVGTHDRQLKVDDVQEAYIEQKDRLLNAIDDTKSVLDDIRTFNKNEWVVRYPQLRDSPTSPEPEHSEPSSSISTPKQRKTPRRSLSFADDPSFETEVVVSEKPHLHRRKTLSSIPDEPEEEDSVSTDKQADQDRLIPASEFNILKLDLKLGPNSSSTAASLVHQLEKSSIANLLDERIGASMSHIDKLRLRVEDTSSKVLVTGDLNAGKSTFVNALLRREVMPVDQQPCTTAFCEVHDAAENHGVEEVHVVKEGLKYDIKDESTYTRGTLTDLEEIVADNEDNDQLMIKLYLADTRAPSESLLNNGVVDISLIDAPGLNRDSIKTTAVFARQEEIDVVVFVVSAENHFTLSAKEFLWNASNEKAYLFIVVNKYDQIKNKEKCRRLVLEQIKQLSPRTFEDAEDLVHFVDSATALQPFTANPAFDDLESALRSFVLVKRSKSKLQPVTTYLNNLLSDIEFLASANSILAKRELEKAKEDLSQSRPVLDKMKNSRNVLEEALENVEEDGAGLSSNKTKGIINDALERVSQGKLGVDNPLIPMPSYPGFLGIWDYVRDVRKAMVSSIDDAIRNAEDEARILTSVGVEKIKKLGEIHLPEGVERSRRVFMPEAMFSVNRRLGKNGNKKRLGSGSVVAGGIHGLGLGLVQRPELLETTFFDLFDVNHQFVVYFGDSSSSSSSPLEDGEIDLDEDSTTTTPSALSIASVGVGALTMVGGQAIGVRGIIEGIVRLSDLFANENTKKWLGPVLGVVTIGLGVWLVVEWPNSIPKTVGRRVRYQVLRSGSFENSISRRSNSNSISTSTPTSSPSSSSSIILPNKTMMGRIGFVEGNCIRISREARKVLRLASWDLRERFRGALEERQKEVKGAEELEMKAENALKWFEDVKVRGAKIEGLVVGGGEDECVVVM